MTRALILVMDSFGIGAADDAEAFGDVGSDTLGHIAEACAAGKADVDGGRSGPLSIPNLEKLGLGLAARQSAGKLPQGFGEVTEPTGVYGFSAEQSRGKDTPSGHWEIAGVPVDFDWGYFPDTCPSFPPELTDAFVREAGLPGILGDCHASGTQIIDALGEEHVRTGKPIVYTSADSVYQIAASETHFGLQRLYEICEIARALVDEYEIGRVIARPFVGETRADFVRTANRRDYATPPPAPTLLDKLTQDGGEVFAIGKIGDIYAHRGTTHEIKASGHDALFDATLKTMETAGERSLIFTNFVDFDMHFGHRRDVPGYAGALEHFDARLPQLMNALRPGDLAVITADHGCDPSWRGTDHTRENVPVIAFGPDIAPKSIGPRKTFADIGQTIAAHLGLAPLNHGTAFI
ncbi:MAG: phosphopentomutase [Alphaproteobacteria bacterium]|nr:phosphopentomutase [Alphaproteobacteria bacterium]